MKIKSFKDYLKEELDGSTTATPGSGTAVGGGAEGSFTSAMGVSWSGGDSGSAFSTNSSVAGMGAIVSPQPSSIPGDVAGSTKGSGDIGTMVGAYGKMPARAIASPSKKKSKKKKSKKSKRRKTASAIDNLYVSKYSEKYDNKNHIISSWKVFTEDKK